MATLKKSALATLVGAAAMAAAGAANATIVVGGENGYSFSVDGNINQFYIHTNQNNTGGDQRNSQVANGLLPTFFGFNVSAPEMNGLTVGARVSISPSTNNGSLLDANDGTMEQREAFATVDGSFGQILMGKALGVYSANNILLDQTLFGVGATTFNAFGDQNTGPTSVGRIGWGYEYAYWRSQVRYTTPDMNGFQAAFAIVDNDTSFIGNDVAEKDPRFEASLSYAGAFDNGSYKLWLDGMTSRVKFDDVGNERSNAWTIGGQLVVSGFEFVGAYYDSKGQGIAGLGGLGAYKNDGKARKGDGYYVQAGYRFAGQTLASISYGQSKLDRDRTVGALGDADWADFDKNRMTTFGIYHDVTANLKLVAEYSRMETKYYGESKAKVDAFSLGGFVSW